MLGNAAGILAVYTVSYAEFFMEEDECSNGIRKRSREKASYGLSLLYIKCFIAGHARRYCFRSGHTDIKRL